MALTGMTKFRVKCWLELEELRDNADVRRPSVKVESFVFLGDIDFLEAAARFARICKAMEIEEEK